MPSTANDTTIPSVLTDVRATPLGKLHAAATLDRLRPDRKHVPVAAFNSSL